MALSDIDLKSLLDFSIHLAREAGQLILKGSDAILTASGNSVEEKKNSVDLVTEYDRQVEDLVRNRIRDKYPTFAFIGEEETSAQGVLPDITDGPTFCVDPIDGTTNFVHGYPYCCVSIGFLLQKRPVLGVIYNPFLDWLYHGVIGQGSYLIKRDTQPLRLPLYPPRPLPSLSQALIAVEWGSDRSASAIQARADSFSRLAGDGKQIKGGLMAHSLKSLGSAALNFAAVAAGQLDIYWEIGCWPWDVAAGTIIAQEAGALVNTCDLSRDGGEVTGDMSGDVLAGRKYIVIRAISDNKDETGVESQKRLVKEFCATISDFSPN